MSLYRSATQALTAAYGATIVLESGARAISVTLDDFEIAFMVRIDGVNEESVPAGSSWQLQPPQPGITGDLGIEIMADSGTPNASIIWFR